MIQHDDWTDPDRIPPPPEPPCWSAAHQAWVVSRHADVQAVLRHPAMAAADPGVELARMAARTGRAHPNLAAALEGTMLFQSGPRHRASRMVMRTVLARLQRAWTPPALLAEARAIAAALPTGARIEAAGMLADELPCRVAAAMLGIAPEQVRNLRARSQQTTALWRPMPPLREYARLEALCREAQEELAQAAPVLLGEPEPALDYPLAGLVLFLVVASVDSTAATIASGLDLLARDPALQSRLRAEPALIEPFVAETLRLAGPLRHLNRRIATAPLTVGGQDLPANTGVILQIDRAHRDPLACPNPDAVRLDRGPAGMGAPLLAFGGGAHACQGAVLGQSQIGAMLTAMLETHDLAPAPGRRALADHPVLLQFESLPLRLAPAHAAEREASLLNQNAVGKTGIP